MLFETSYLRYQREGWSVEIVPDTWHIDLLNAKSRMTINRNAVLLVKLTDCKGCHRGIFRGQPTEWVCGGVHRIGLYHAGCDPRRNGESAAGDVR